MEIETRFSVEDITILLRNSGRWNKRTDTMLPNLSWGLLNHEADLCIISKTGYLTEIEIKRSLEDLRADFKKKIFHDDERVYNFYYCLPISIKDKALELFEEHKYKILEFYRCNSTSNIADEYPAIIWYDENGSLSFQGWPMRSGCRKLFLEERDKIGRLMSLRYWDVVEKHNRLLLEQKETDGEIQCDSNAK